MKEEATEVGAGDLFKPMSLITFNILLCHLSLALSVSNKHIPSSARHCYYTNHNTLEWEGTSRIKVWNEATRGNGSFVYIATNPAVLTPKGVNCSLPWLHMWCPIIIQHICFGDESDDCTWCVDLFGKAHTYLSSRYYSQYICRHIWKNDKKTACLYLWSSPCALTVCTLCIHLP